MPKKTIRPSSSNAILGTPAKAPINSSTLCIVCSKPIPAARLNALKAIDLDPSLWAHTSCSTVTKTKGIYLGETGTSQLQLCRKIYDDSVRSVFRNADSDKEESDEIE